MGKPVERQNHSVSFFILAMLIAVCTAWAFYEEFLARRPWKDFQERTFAHEREKSASELRTLERKLESGDIKVVVDPAKPDQTTTVAEAQKRLDEIDQGLAKEHKELDQIRGELKEAEIEASDADIKVKLLKSEDDGQFYKFQNAEHEEALANNQARELLAQGKQSQAEAEQRKAESWKKAREEAERNRQELADQIRKATGEAQAAADKLAAVQARLKGKVGERDRIKAAIEAAKDPILTTKAQLTAASKKSPELSQYWLTTYDNSVDRCQNCHALVDKCGYSRPHEILEALNAPNAKAEEIPAKFCINQERLESYQQTAGEICTLELDREASAKGEPGNGRCLSGDERTAVANFLLNYCGPESPAYRLLNDRALKSGCASQETWQKLADYVEPLEKRGACSIDIKPEGESCVEGAQRDQVLAWVRQHCPEVSATRKGLEQNAKKACASGDAGKKLASIKPVLYNYEVWAQTHPYRTELLGNNHPAEGFGCTTCHEGQGSQTKGVSRREFEHGWDDHYWERPMLDLVSHKKYRPITFSAPASDQGVPGEWVRGEKEYVESTCAKCHSEAVQLKFADTYTKGRRLAGEVGCHGCHPIDAFKDFPKLGPILTDLQKKTTPAFLMTWISYPKLFRPRTKMPNFWPEALNVDHTLRQGSPEAAQREEEVKSIVAYLWKNAEGAELPAVPVRGDAERGKQLVQVVGCRGCHAFVPQDKLCTPEQIAAGKSRGTPQEPGECEVARGLSGSAARDFAPNLSNISYKTNERWLFAWLKNPSAMWPQTRMPNLRLSDQEAADVVAYLMTLKNGSAPKAQLFFDKKDSPELAAAAAAGDKLITKYGCPGCHDIKGHENDAKIGAELNEFGRKAVDLLDFGNAIPNPRHHTWYNWIDLKLRAPRAYRYERVDTRMPQFDFNDTEVDELMVFLKSRYAEKTPHSYLADADERHAAIAHGDQLIDFYNCRGCHVIDFQGGSIRDVYAEDDLYKAPPILQQEGWRVQPDWMFGFLHDPSSKLRPWLDVRMPTFPLTDAKATTVVQSFSARANVPYPYITAKVPELPPKALAEAKAMVDDQLKCFKCHTAGAPSADQDPASLAPNLELAKRRLRPDWVEAWIRNPQSLQEGTRMPNFFTPDNLSTVMYPKYFGGSQERQIKVLRDYVMTLPDSGASKAQTVSKKPPKKRRAALGSQVEPKG